MATIDKESARILIESNGVYPGDPKCFAVCEYDNSYQGYELCYHVSYEPEDYVNLFAHHTARLLWDRVNGLTRAGERFMLEVGRVQ